uniref:Uncharacterized protein n=1 Tax=Rhizophora mucronata TaxID=61149 RepID=A0A2P2IZ11_RHIMU
MLTVLPMKIDGYVDNAAVGIDLFLFFLCSNFSKRKKKGVNSILWPNPNWEIKLKKTSYGELY